MPWATTLRNVMLPLTLAHISKGEAEARSAEMLTLNPTITPNGHLP